MYDNKITICLKETQDLEEFIKAASECEFDIDVKYKTALIDAKSILGMLAIGLKNNITVCYGGCNESFDRVVSKYAIA